MSNTLLQHTQNLSEANCIDQFKEYFSRIDSDSIHRLDSFYADEIIFRDPLHHIQGLDPLKKYFGKLNKNLISGSFTFHSTDIAGSKAWLEWTMTLELKRPNKKIVTDGISILSFEDKIVKHQDYFDLGALIYEHIPLMGGAIKMLKKNFAR